MATTLEELGSLMIKPREVEGLEFKEAKTQYDSTKLFKYCVAIANEGGGKFILGVTDELPRKVVGTQAINDPPGMEKQILDKLRFRVTIEDLNHPGEMDRTDRIRACYQHAALKFVMREQMTNQSLRDRFHLAEAKSAIVSQIIAATLDAGLIKTDERSGGSRKFARYVPFWA